MERSVPGPCVSIETRKICHVFHHCAYHPCCIYEYDLTSFYAHNTKKRRYRYFKSDGHATRSNLHHIFTDGKLHRVYKLNIGIVTCMAHRNVTEEIPTYFTSRRILCQHPSYKSQHLDLHAHIYRHYGTGNHCHLAPNTQNTHYQYL
jgi:hypothetical protein